MNQAYQVSTIAGNGQSGSQDGNALEAMFSYPMGLCCSNDGRLYVTDQGKHRISMVYENQVTTIAGNGQSGFRDGNALEAMFSEPNGICCSDDGRLYVSDQDNRRIRMIYNNQVTTIAGNGQSGFQDGNALESSFSCPSGICCSKDGKLYFTEYSNHKVRMIHNSQVTTIAGNGLQGFQDGNALEAMFYNPTGICCSNNGRLYVADHYNHRIRMIYNNQVTTIAGNGLKGFQDGNALESMFYNPSGICCSNDGRLYVADQNSHRIRMIYNNQVTTIAGNGKYGSQDGNALEATFNYPWAICCSQDDRLYVSDYCNHIIRMIYNNRVPVILQKALFSFAHLLDMQNTFSDREISFKGVSYHLHSTFINVRCSLLFDQDHFSLIQQSNISNKSFDSFVTFLYSNRLTKEYNQIMTTTISIKDIVELIFIFDILMNCKWILTDLKTRFEKQLFKMLNVNEEESVRKLVVEQLPFVWNLKELINTKPVKTNTITTNNKSYTEYCYNILIDELQKKRSIVPKYVANLQQSMTTNQGFLVEVAQMLSETSQITIDPLVDDDESMVDIGAELTELSKLAFEKTNISKIDKTETIVESSSTTETTLSSSTTTTTLSSLIPTHHLDAWTRPDFVIKLSNDDDDISYHVHKLILCGRWKYFSLMIESGLKEVNDNEMTLSEDWNKSRFEKMMKYIYLNEIEFESLEDAEWLIENGRLYGISVDQSQSDNNEVVGETGAYGFEALYDHCVCILRD